MTGVPQSELTVARLCALSHLGRAGYYRHFRASAPRQEETTRQGHLRPCGYELELITARGSIGSQRPYEITVKLHRLLEPIVTPEHFVADHKRGRTEDPQCLGVVGLTA